jgi:hypothetical protein
VLISSHPGRPTPSTGKPAVESLRGVDRKRGPRLGTALREGTPEHAVFPLGAVNPATGANVTGEGDGIRTKIVPLAALPDPDPASRAVTCVVGSVASLLRVAARETVVDSGPVRVVSPLRCGKHRRATRVRPSWSVRWSTVSSLRLRSVYYQRRNCLEKVSLHSITFRSVVQRYRPVQ